MGVEMKRKAAVAIIVILSFPFLMTTSQASERKPTPPPVKSKAVKIVCHTTSAAAHIPKQVGTPPMPKRMMMIRSSTLTLKTNCGDISILTNAAKAPLTVNAIYMLANSGYYDQSLCHRLTTKGIYVLQCGDPTASGSGGPSFYIPDEPNAMPASVNNNYPAGTVAMANAGPNTNGSQFFLVYANTTLPPSYTIWGQITKGLDIVKAIAAAGVVDGSSDGTPKQSIAIESISISSK